MHSPFDSSQQKSGLANVESDDMAVYLNGQELYGNDFTQTEIDHWFADEAEGYFNLTQADSGKYSYGYHALNARHGFSILPERRFGHVLGVGSAYGDELAPILDKCDQISILEPSDGFISTTIGNVPVTYVKPVASGVIPFSSESLDLITCLGVLHHIPNVGKVVDEFYRVLKPGGYVLLREPIISMGDWRIPRAGLTKRERGIPLNILSAMLDKSGFTVVSARKCVFSLTTRFRYVMRGPVYNNPFVVLLDHFLCALPLWPSTYHAKNSLQKLRPTAVFFVLHKRAGADRNI